MRFLRHEIETTDESQNRNNRKSLHGGENCGDQGNKPEYGHWITGPGENIFEMLRGFPCNYAYTERKKQGYQNLSINIRNPEFTRRTILLLLQNKNSST